MARLVGKQKKARYVSRSVENWRRLKNYPNYEVSNYGRVRASARKDADSFLKPRWFKGKPFVVITDIEGKRCERAIYWLMSDAGWIEEKRRPWLGMRVNGLSAAQMGELEDMYRSALRLANIEYKIHEDFPNVTIARVCPADPTHDVDVSFYPAMDGDKATRSVFCYDCVKAGRPDPIWEQVLQKVL